MILVRIGPLAVSGQFDAHAVPLGLMVRSRDLRPARFRRLVRGVSNHVAAPSFETGATLGLCVPKAHPLAPSSG